MNELFQKIKHDKLGIFIGIILTAVVFYGVYTYRLSIQEPVTVVKGAKNYTVARGESFLLCRTVNYDRTTSLEITRVLVKEKENSIFDVDFPKVFVHRVKGLKKICREVYIPGTVSLGNWKLETLLTIYTPPFWRHTYSIPSINLKIIDKKCHKQQKDMK